MPDDGYTTPEGHWLAKPILMPDTRAFSDVLEYLDEWKPAWSPISGRYAETPPAPIYLHENGAVLSATAAEQQGANEIGPYCTVDMRQHGGPAHRGIAVRATDAAIRAIRKRGIVTPDDHLSFKLIAHERSGRVLVTLDHGYIIGGMWLAYIDPETVPTYPFKDRDQRARNVADAIKEAGGSVFRVSRGDYAIQYRDKENPPIGAVIHPDGSVERTWADGSTALEPAAGLP